MIKKSAEQDLKRLNLSKARVARINKLFESSRKARKASHSPYSKFAVGASLTLDGAARTKIYSGCNIENSSYGATVCAERVAIWKALSESPKSTIDTLVVITDTNPAAPPCGMCRQVLQEFATSQTILCQASLTGVERISLASELLPGPFDPSHLRKL